MAKTSLSYEAFKMAILGNKRLEPNATFYNYYHTFGVSIPHPTPGYCSQYDVTIRCGTNQLEQYQRCLAEGFTKQHLQIHYDFGSILTHYSLLGQLSLLS